MKSRYPKLIKLDGKPLCRGCGGEVPKGRQSWCSNKCYQTHCPQMVNHAVKLRDKGICQICFNDISELHKEWYIKKPKLESWNPSVDRFVWQQRTARFYEMFKEWKKYHPEPFPEYDHIIPYSRGGKTILENMRTLCTPCHKKVTAKFSKQRAEERKALKLSKQHSLMLVIILIIATSLTAGAQPTPPVVDTNALAKTRALVAAIQATNIPVVQPAQVVTIFNLPVTYPDWYPVSAYLLRSTNGKDWQFILPYNALQSNTFTFTNPVPPSNAYGYLYMTVLIPPNTISVPNIYPATNTVTNSTSSSK